MLALRYDPVQLDGDLADEPDPSGGVETEVLIALGTDARADALVLPPGIENRGYWADGLIDDGEQLGSLLWLLEQADASPETLARVSELAELALAPVIASGRIAQVSATGVQTGAHVELAGSFSLPGGARIALGPLRIN